MMCHIIDKIYSCVTLVYVIKLCYTYPRSNDTIKNKSKKVSRKRSFMGQVRTNRGGVPPRYFFSGSLIIMNNPTSLSIGLGTPSIIY